MNDMTPTNNEHWAIPSNACWLVFDLSNGDPLSRRYVWWFETLKAARDHIAWQKKQKFSADLSPPMKFIPAFEKKRRMKLNKSQK
jgi:hypothetical protein